MKAVYPRGGGKTAHICKIICKVMCPNKPIVLLTESHLKLTQYCKLTILK